MSEQPTVGLREVLRSTTDDLIAREEMGLLPFDQPDALIKAACEAVDEHLHVPDGHILDAYSMLVGGTLTAVGIHFEKIEDADAP